MREIKTAHGQQWRLIFHHDCSSGLFFTDDIESTCNGSYCDDEYRYSRLSLLNDMMKIGGKFEFLLEYKETEEYEHFTQVLNPIEVQETDQPREIGFKSIHHGFNRFRGFIKTNMSFLGYLDGVDGIGFWFLIGAKRTYSSSSEIGPYNYAGPEIETTESFLWIRMSFCECSRKIYQYTIKIFLINILIS